MSQDNAKRVRTGTSLMRVIVAPHESKAMKCGFGFVAFENFTDRHVLVNVTVVGKKGNRK